VGAVEGCPQSRMFEPAVHLLGLRRCAAPVYRQECLALQGGRQAGNPVTRMCVDMGGGHTMWLCVCLACRYGGVVGACWVEGGAGGGGAVVSDGHLLGTYRCAAPVCRQECLALQGSMQDRQCCNK
jgi:hypothetical protein